MNEHSGVPSPELIKEWIREANHNEPLFAQVAVMGARWGYEQGLKEGGRQMQKILCEVANYVD